MIIIAIIIGVFGTFLSFIYIKNISLRAVLTIISLLILGVSVFTTIRNDTAHYLMKPQNKITQDKKIYATKSEDGLNLMVYQNLGNQKKHDIQTYRKNNNQKSPSSTQADEYTTNKIKYINGNNAHLKTNIKKWEFTKSGQFWFGITNWKFKNDKSDARMINRTNTFYIPKDWIHLSADQAKQLSQEIQKQQSNPQSQQSQQLQIQQIIQSKLKAAAQKDPNIIKNDKLKQAKIEQFTDEYREQVTQQKIQQIKQLVKNME